MLNWSDLQDESNRIEPDEMGYQVAEPGLRRQIPATKVTLSLYGVSI